MGHKGHPVKFQILTREMKRIADLGITAHWKYKESPLESREQQAV